MFEHVVGVTPEQATPLVAKALENIEYGRIDALREYLETLPDSDSDGSAGAAKAVDALDSEMHRTMLHVAAGWARADAVEALLEAGANPNAADDVDEETALHIACESGSLACVEKLVDAGCELDRANGDGWTALHIAATEGHEGIVKELLDAGADIDRANVDGWSALRLARAEGEKGVVQAIRDAVKRRKEKALAKKEQRTRCVLDRI